MNSAAIGFASDLVPLLVSGAKTFTYRIGDTYDFLTVGDEIDVRDSGSGKVFGRVKIIEKSYTTLKDLPLDRIGHEVYSSKQEQVSTFEKYYGEVKGDDKVTIFGFKLIS